MNYTVTNITPLTDQETGEHKTDAYGNKRYKVFVKDEKGQIFNFSKGYKGEPNKTGDTLTGTIEQKEGNYGKYWQFTADRPAFGGGGGGFQRSPEDQDRIMRQHAVTDALSFFNLQPLATKKAADEHTILLQAERFLAYYKNGLKVTATANPAQNAPQHEAEPLPEYEEGEDFGDISGYAEMEG